MKKQSRELAVLIPLKLAKKLADKPRWRPIRSMPQTGEKVLCYDVVTKEFMVANKPLGCFLGKWDLDSISGKWTGSASFWPVPTHWMPLPKNVPRRWPRSK